MSSEGGGNRGERGRTITGNLLTMVLVIAERRCSIRQRRFFFFFKCCADRLQQIMTVRTVRQNTFGSFDQPLPPHLVDARTLTSLVSPKSLFKRPTQISTDLNITTKINRGGGHRHQRHVFSFSRSRQRAYISKRTK